MIEIIGKAGIRVRVLAHSINAMGNEVISYELVYPRIIHAELLTHGMLVRNAASSRAIPFEKMLKQLTGRPVRFGAANKGMQDKGEDFEELVDIGPALGLGHPFVVSPEDAWETAKEGAVKFSKAFFDAGYAKQIFNRTTEPYQMMKTVLSGTEFDNFFWLRDHEAADPSLHELARCMRLAKEQSVPVLLKPGQWHLPYVECDYVDGEQNFFITKWLNNDALEVEHLTPEEAVKVSAARSAAVSFRNEGYDLAKTIEVYDRLVGDQRKHASAFQHQATPMIDNGLSDKTTIKAAHNDPMFPKSWQPGVTHTDREGKLWSAQFCGWIMNRKLIPGENYYEPK